MHLIASKIQSEKNMSFYPKNRLLEKIRPLAFSIPTVPNCQPYSIVFSDKNDKSPALTENSYLRLLCPFDLDF